jgi:hypothetical protein
MKQMTAHRFHNFLNMKGFVPHGEQPISGRQVMKHTDLEVVVVMGRPITVIDMAGKGTWRYPTFEGARNRICDLLPKWAT